MPWASWVSGCRASHPFTRVPVPWGALVVWSRCGLAPSIEHERPAQRHRATIQWACNGHRCPSRSGSTMRLSPSYAPSDAVAVWSRCGLDPSVRRFCAGGGARRVKACMSTTPSTPTSPARARGRAAKGEWVPTDAPLPLAPVAARAQRGPGCRRHVMTWDTPPVILEQIVREQIETGATSSRRSSDARSSGSSASSSPPS